jgi:VWFA-related protein
MARRDVFLARALFLLILTFSIQSIAPADDFGMIVGNVEKHYHARKRKIPFVGLAGFAVKLIHPAGVKSVKLAIFDDQDFAPGQRDRAFEHAIEGSLNRKWKPMVRATSRKSGDRSYVYSYQSGKDIELLTMTFSSKQAIVAQAKINPEAMAKFLDKPELLGFSLAGGMSGSPSIFDSASSGNWGSSPGDSSLDRLGDRDVSSVAADPRSKPALRTRAADDSDFNPLGTGETAPKTKFDEDSIHLEARLINLNVKAIDRNGASLSALRKEDFRVFEEGVEQDIFYFEPVSAPINLVLLLDLSGSTRDSRKVMIETGRKFIDSLGAGDRVAVAAFTRDFKVVSDFTADKNLLKKALDKVKKIEGGTAFYDGMWATFDLLQRVKDSRKAIVVLTDGVDNSLMDSGYEPTTHSFDGLLARVEEEDATIYPIYLNPEERRLMALLNEPGTSESRRERVERRLKPNVTAHRQIEMLAEESAGSVFVAEGEEELDGVYQRVAAELRLLYTLAYAPKNGARDGKFRKINVAVKRDGAVVKTRRGYLAK